jgi:hypothetical protein
MPAPREHKTVQARILAYARRAAGRGQSAARIRLIESEFAQTIDNTPREQLP